MDIYILYGNVLLGISLAILFMLGFIALMVWGIGEHIAEETQKRKEKE